MILICYGTRPEYIKIKPLIDRLDESKFKTLFTGQHKDLCSEYNPDFSLEILDGCNRLDSVISSCMNIDDDKIYKNITHVLIQGDTTSVLGIAISAYHRGIKIIHLEAGLRTYDFENPYPEEGNRQLVSRIADYHLCPTEFNKQNLINEKVKGKIFVTGNTVLDNLSEYKSKCEYTNKVLVTLHRRENHDKIEKWFGHINKIAKKYKDLEFIFPIHPNPNVQKYRHILTNINVIEPLNHNDLLNLLVKCKFVISDSGGIQEECSFFNKKIIVCRTITERPESVDYHSIMCESVDSLPYLVETVYNDFIVDYPCPYGDGHATEKIINILNNFFIT